MTTLYVDRSGTALAWRDGALEIRVPAQPMRRVPGALVERVVLRSDTTLGSSTLAALADQGIALIAFGGRGGQRVAHVVGAHAKDARARIAQCQRLTDDAWIVTWCRAIVRQRILGQIRLLQRAMRDRADLRKHLFDAIATLNVTLERLPVADGRDAVRGLEGAGAAAFFRGYTQLFPAAAEFHRRRRRPPPDPVNACLSLGYTLLHGNAVQACWGAGLDPMVGFLHLPSPGRESLACDLVEPWRIRVEAWVWEAWQTRTLRAEHFGRDGSGACLIGKAGRQHFYSEIHPVLMRCRKGLARQARIVARSLAGKADGLSGDEDWESGDCAR